MILSRVREIVNDRGVCVCVRGVVRDGFFDKVIFEIGIKGGDELRGERENVLSKRSVLGVSINDKEISVVLVE